METILTYSATCPVSLIKRILETYRTTSNDISKGLFELVKKTDLSNSTGRMPLSFLSEMTTWIEKHLGPANMKMIGNLLGENAYHQIRATEEIAPKPAPKDAIAKLVRVSQIIFQDPLRKYWEVIETSSNQARVKKCALLNITMQIGIIESFLRKCSVSTPRVRLVRDYKRGSEYDEFEIMWF